MPSLNSKLDFYLTNNYNVLFVGEHGIGKTAIMTDAFDRNNVTWKYFSSPTIDPWADLIGIPKEKIDENGESYLDLLRPREFQNDEIEFLFFDEFNRAPSKVRNAVMELMQFKSINGFKFNNLRGVWAAINPPDEEGTYDVDELDPAQQDRFHATIVLPNTPNLTYFCDKYGDMIGKRGVDWWNSLPSNIQKLVSPRRLDYALDVYTKGGWLGDVLPPETIPSKLKAKLELITSTHLSHKDYWINDADEYFERVSHRTTTIDIVAAFDALYEISVDQLSLYLDKLPHTHLNTLAKVSDKIFGIMLIKLMTESQDGSRGFVSAIRSSVKKGTNFNICHVDPGAAPVHNQPILQKLTHLGQDPTAEGRWQVLNVAIHQQILSHKDPIPLSTLMCIIKYCLEYACKNIGSSDQHYKQARKTEICDIMTSTVKMCVTQISVHYSSSAKEAAEIDFTTLALMSKHMKK